MSSPRGSFRSSDIKRKRSIVVPADSVESFSSAIPSQPSGAWEDGDVRKEENTQSPIEDVETKRRGQNIEHEVLMLNTLIQLKQSTENGVACSNTVITILDSAITAMQSGIAENLSSVESPSETAPSWLPWIYLYRKVKHSSLWSLLAGSHLLIGECDEIVNALILVNALVLTIPFAIIPDLNFAYWTDLKEYLEMCDSDLVRPFDEVRDIYRSSTLAVIYTSIGCITVACVYYIFRPRHDSTFQQWWVRGGRDAMALLILGTGVCVINIFFLTSYIFHYYSVHPEWLCDPRHSDKGITFSWIGYCVVFLYIFIRLL